MTAITEADVRQYVREATSTDDILRAIAVVDNLQGGDLFECRVVNAALIAVAIAQARMPATAPEPPAPETDDSRQLLHRALSRSLRLPG